MNVHARKRCCALRKLHLHSWEAMQDPEGTVVFRSSTNTCQGMTVRERTGLPVEGLTTLAFATLNFALQQCQPFATHTQAVGLLCRCAELQDCLEGIASTSSHAFAPARVSFISSHSCACALRASHCSPRCRGAHFMMSSTLKIISAASVADSTTWAFTCTQYPWGHLHLARPFCIPRD